MMQSPHAIAAAPPIEGLPSQRKTSHADICRKHLHVLNSHVADCDTEVGYVLRLGDAVAVHRPEHQCPQDEEVERALEQLDYARVQGEIGNLA